MSIRQGDSKFDAGKVNQTSVVRQMSQCKMWVSVVTLHRLLFVLWTLQRLISPGLIPGLISSYLYVKELNFCSSQKLGGSPKKNVVEPIQKPD